MGGRWELRWQCLITGVIVALRVEQMVNASFPLVIASSYCFLFLPAFPRFRYIVWMDGVLGFYHAINLAYIPSHLHLPVYAYFPCPSPIISVFSIPHTNSHGATHISVPPSCHRQTNTFVLIFFYILFSNARTRYCLSA